MNRAKRLKRCGVRPGRRVLGAFRTLEVRGIWTPASRAVLVLLLAGAVLGCGEGRDKNRFGATAFSAVSGERGVVAGRTVIVSVVDENAEPVEGAEVSALTDPSDP